MELPFISIVMPLYNKEKEVGRAIRSALAQTFTDFELIIVNDGSTDGSVEVVEDIEDVRLRIIHQTNQGVSAARNRGIQEAKADLIAFLDADDEWKPDYLETILRLVNKFPEASVFATGYMIKQSGGYERGAIVRGLPEGFSEEILENYFTVAAHSDPPLWTSAVAVRKEAIQAVGGFPAGIYAGEDLLTWARLAVKYNIAYAIEPKAVFWQPLNPSERPGRVPAVNDAVGKGLKTLLVSTDVSLHKYLKRYIALWHLMRASIYIQLAGNREARGELIKAFRMNGLTVKLILLFLLSLLPGRTGQRLFLFRRRVRA